MTKLVTPLALLLVVFGLGHAQAEDLTLSGTVTRIRDSDTVQIGGMAVWLQGLYAPKLDTEAGQKAIAFMETLILHKVVVCQLTGEVSYDRQVGVCWLDRRDIAAQLVSAGLGRDCPRYSKGRYAALETQEGKRMGLPGYCR